jgi:hypothetical protein
MMGVELRRMHERAELTEEQLWFNAVSRALASASSSGA